MKTKLISVTYRGKVEVDPRFSEKMLRWSIDDILSRQYCNKLSIGIENKIIEAYNSDFELLFSHDLKHIVGLCIVQNSSTTKSILQDIDKQENNFIQISGPQNGIVYLLKNPSDPLLHIYLFESDSLSEMINLLHQMRDTTAQESSKLVENIATKSTFCDGTFSKSFNMQGIHVTPASYLKSSEMMRNAQHDTSIVLSSRMSFSKSYTNGLSQSGIKNIPKSFSVANLSLSNHSPNHSQFFEVLYIGKIRIPDQKVQSTFIDDSLPKFKQYDAQRLKILEEQQNLNEINFKEINLNEQNENSEQNKETNSDNDKVNFRHPLQQILSFTPTSRDRSASIGSTQVNRTMVLLIGRSDLRLISPDRKQMLLYKDFKDIYSCVRGQNNANHFGIICRDTQSDIGFIGYVFKCQSDNVSNDIVSSISQAFLTLSEQKTIEKSQIFSCDKCPMLWYHKLCTDVDVSSDKKIQTIIFRRIETLSDDEQQLIMTKYYGADNIHITNKSHTVKQQNQFLMMLLRAHCEFKHQNHIHDLTEVKTELHQFLNSNTIFMKAKRSLTSSFDQLLKRKSTKDELTVVNANQSKDQQHLNCDYGRSSKSSDLNISKGTVKHSLAFKQNNVPQLKSPIMDILVKVANNTRDSNSASTHYSASWRQEIFHKVTPSKNHNQNIGVSLLSPVFHQQNNKKYEKRTKNELRELWRIAIKQTILLSRMEKENARLQERQNENEIKRIKLEYDEITQCEKDTYDMWDQIIKLNKTVKLSRENILEAMNKGVPRNKRGEVWIFLADQYDMNVEDDIEKFPNINTPYHVLLKNLTEHQHAIFIDLGRTFPTHTYYKQSLGVGQLSLFNLLKAYSILDPELGYCQGLGFICGILLLHLEEAEAFRMLKHLMFNRNFRSTYLPDMKHFQLQLYQLSRLLRDYLPQVYNWLDKIDISPTLYAASWFLTIFSSQFPLGFVAKIFDYLFLDSSEVIFKVSLALLEIHQEELLKRDNFEDVIDYIKNSIPKITNVIIDEVMKQIYTMNISKLLSEYEIEYNVLQEEISTQNRHLNILKKTTAENLILSSELQSAHSTIKELDECRIDQEQQIWTLQKQVFDLGISMETLKKFVNEVIDRKLDINIPIEIQRIIKQFSENDFKKDLKLPLKVFIKEKTETDLFFDKIKNSFQNFENNDTIFDLDSGFVGTPDSPDFLIKTPIE